MKRLVLICVLIVGLTTAAATAAKSRVGSSPSAGRCGGSLWRMKTMSDPQRKLVRLAPATTTIGGIGKRAHPRLVPSTRRTRFQRQVWNVVSQITSYRLEPEGVRLVLFDGGSYINAVIPVPNCLTDLTRARGQISLAWKTFALCARPTGDWQSLGAVAYVGGVGFWGARGQGRGPAPNGAELHPVTSIRIVAGC